MKQLFILPALIFFISPIYAQTEKWYNEEQYDIIRNVDTLQAGDVTFIKRIVNDTAGYYKGACVDVYCDIEDVSSYTYAYPDITLRYYNFDFEDIIPEDFTGLKKYFTKKYNIHDKTIVLIRSNKHGASHVSLFYHVFSIKPELKYLGNFKWYWWNGDYYGEKYFCDQIELLTRQKTIENEKSND